jgi:hypothetical protein
MNTAAIGCEKLEKMNASEEGLAMNCTGVSESQRSVIFILT